MKRYGKRDKTHAPIRTRMLLGGWSWAENADAGAGHPDAWVAKYGFTAGVECKSKGGKLTPEQREFHRSWQGKLIVPQSPDEAIDAANKLLGDHMGQRACGAESERSRIMRFLRRQAAQHGPIDTGLTIRRLADAIGRGEHRLLGRQS